MYFISFIVFCLESTTPKLTSSNSTAWAGRLTSMVDSIFLTKISQDWYNNGKIDEG